MEKRIPVTEGELPYQSCQLPMECGTANYYSQFEDTEYEEVLQSFNSIFASVKRCLDGDLEIIGTMEQIDKELADYNHGDHQSNVVFGSRMICDEWTRSVDGTEDGHAQMLEEVFPLASSSSSSGTHSYPSFNESSLLRLSSNDLVLIASSFGFLLPCPEEILNCLWNMELGWTGNGQS